MQARTCLARTNTAAVVTPIKLNSAVHKSAVYSTMTAVLAAWTETHYGERPRAARITWRRGTGRAIPIFFVRVPLAVLLPAVCVLLGHHTAV